jgi:hypothetical protein
LAARIRSSAALVVIWRKCSAPRHLGQRNVAGDGNGLGL